MRRALAPLGHFEPTATLVAAERVAKHLSSPAQHTFGSLDRTVAQTGRDAGARSRVSSKSDIQGKASVKQRRRWFGVIGRLLLCYASFLITLLLSSAFAVVLVGIDLAKYPDRCAGSAGIAGLGCPVDVDRCSSQASPWRRCATWISASGLRSAGADSGNGAQPGSGLPLGGLAPLVELLVLWSAS
jgi:hypothetical protein